MTCPHCGGSNFTPHQPWNGVNYGASVQRCNECGAVADETPVAPEQADEPVAEDLSALTVARLREIATERGVDVPKAANKAALIEALTAVVQSEGAPEGDPETPAEPETPAAPERAE